MNGTNRLLRWILVLSLLFNAGFAGAVVYSVFIAPPPSDATATPESLPEVYRAELDLTEQQHREISTSRASMLEQIRGLREEVRTERSQLWGLVAKESPNQDAIDNSIASISASQRQIQEKVVEHLLWVRTLLEPDQATRFSQALTNNMCRCAMCDGGCLHPVGPRGEDVGPSCPGAGQDKTKKEGCGCGAKPPEASP